MSVMTITKKTAASAAMAAALLAAFSGAAAAMPQAAEKGVEMTVSGSAAETLQNDQAVLSFSIEVQKADASAAAQEAVEAANAALRALKALDPKRVVVQTTGLSTSPVYSTAKPGETAAAGAWRVRESVSVKVSDVSYVPQVLKAAEPMHYDGISYSISRAARRAAEDRLLADAMKDAGARAVLAAQAMGLGERNVKIETVSIGSSAAPSPLYYAAPRMLGASMKVNAAADAAEVSAGEGEVSMSVSLKVRITP